MGKLYYYNQLNELFLEMKKYNGILWGITGMHANPIHAGHINLLESSYKQCEALIVALNNDEACKRKHGYSFMPFDHRAAILTQSIYVDYVIENPFDTMEVLLATLPVKLYFKGGDVTSELLHKGEKVVCQQKDIEIRYGVGGGKIASSSEFLEKYWEWRDSSRDWPDDYS